LYRKYVCITGSAQPPNGQGASKSRRRGQKERETREQRRPRSEGTTQRKAGEPTKAKTGHQRDPRTRGRPASEGQKTRSHKGTQKEPRPRPTARLARPTEKGAPRGEERQESEGNTNTVSSVTGKGRGPHCPGLSRGETCTGVTSTQAMGGREPPDPCAPHRTQLTPTPP